MINQCPREILQDVLFFLRPQYRLAWENESVLTTHLKKFIQSLSLTMIQNNIQIQRYLINYKLKNDSEKQDIIAMPAASLKTLLDFFKPSEFGFQMDNLQGIALISRQSAAHGFIKQYNLRLINQTMQQPQFNFVVLYLKKMQFLLARHIKLINFRFQSLLLQEAEGSYKVKCLSCQLQTLHHFILCLQTSSYVQIIFYEINPNLQQHVNELNRKMSKLPSYQFIFCQKGLNNNVIAITMGLTHPQKSLLNLFIKFKIKNSFFRKIQIQRQTLKPAIKENAQQQKLVDQSSFLEMAELIQALDFGMKQN